VKALRVALVALALGLVAAPAASAALTFETTKALPSTIDAMPLGTKVTLPLEILVKCAPNQVDVFPDGIQVSFASNDQNLNTTFEPALVATTATHICPTADPLPIVTNVTFMRLGRELAGSPSWSSVHVTLTGAASREAARVESVVPYERNISLLVPRHVYNVTPGSEFVIEISATNYGNAPVLATTTVVELAQYKARTLSVPGELFMPYVVNPSSASQDNLSVSARAYPGVGNVNVTMVFEIQIRFDHVEVRSGVPYPLGGPNATWEALHVVHVHVAQTVKEPAKADGLPLVAALGALAVALGLRRHA
jgi:hypothetical protein